MFTETLSGPVTSPPENSTSIFGVVVVEAVDAVVVVCRDEVEGTGVVEDAVPPAPPTPQATATMHTSATSAVRVMGRTVNPSRPTDQSASSLLTCAG